MLLVAGDMLLEDGEEFVVELDVALGEQNLQARVDKVEMQDAVFEAVGLGQEFGLQCTEGERCIAPSFLENAVNLIEQEEDAVLLVESKFHLARAEGFACDDVRVGKLQDEHGAIGVKLEHAAIGLCLDGQREFLPDFETGIIVHDRPPNHSCL